MSERELVMVDTLSNYPDIKALKAVVQTLERESAEVLDELRAEIRKRTEEMLADAAEAGVVLSKPEKSTAGPGRPKGKKKDSVVPEPEPTTRAAVEAATPLEILDAE